MQFDFVNQLAEVKPKYFSVVENKAAALAPHHGKSTTTQKSQHSFFTKHQKIHGDYNGEYYGSS